MGVSLLPPGRGSTQCLSASRAEITLDFSVEESFVEGGTTGPCTFKPVVGAEAVVVNGDTTSTGS